jgi:hypothetical protein
MLLKFILYEKVNNSIRNNKKYDFSINSPNFDEIVHVDTRLGGDASLDVHGRFELRRFAGEADLRLGNDIPRGRTLKMYQFPSSLFQQGIRSCGHH